MSQVEPKFRLDRTNPQATDIEQDIQAHVIAMIDPAYLTDEEFERLKPKLDLVNRAALRLVAGMIKGTIKYPHDNLDADAWIEHAYDEAADQLNYLQFAKQEREKFAYVQEANS